MSSTARSIWFQGDWSDPWLEGLVAAFPRDATVVRLDVSRPIPGDRNPPELLIIHRSKLLPRDVDHFASWKKGATWQRFPATILCYGPFARYAELERWLPLVDTAIPDATAADSLPRRVESILGYGQAPPTARDEAARVVVVSTNVDLRRTLADACSEWVSRIQMWPEMRSSPPSDQGAGLEAREILTILDVPLLESSWESQLEAAARLGPVIALLGFADRSTVGKARSLGARACLELPFDRDDLGHALLRCLEECRAGRSSRSTGFDPAHRLPRPPSTIRIARPSRREV